MPVAWFAAASMPRTNDPAVLVPAQKPVKQQVHNNYHLPFDDDDDDTRRVKC